VGYNLTKQTVERQLEKLQVLYDTRQTRDFPSSNPRSLSYKLREAIKAAAIHNQYRHFTELQYIYKFKTLDGSVRAEYTGYVPHVETVRPAREDEPGEVPVDIETLHIPDAITLFDVIGAGLNFPHAPELHFQNVRLFMGEQEKLYKWGKEIGWKLIEHPGEGVTLTKREVDDSILWTPEREQGREG